MSRPCRRTSRRGRTRRRRMASRSRRNKANVRADQTALTADEAKQKKACAGSGASRQACSQDTQQVASDKTALSQAQQQLGAGGVGREDRRRPEAGQGRRRPGQAGGGPGDPGVGCGRMRSIRAPPTPGCRRGPGDPAGPAGVCGQRRAGAAAVRAPSPLTGRSTRACPTARDVAELTRDLIALGYGTAWRRAIITRRRPPRRWTAGRSAGLPVTGQILLGEVVFEPGPIRVTSVTPTVGASSAAVAAAAAGAAAAGGTVLTATGIKPVVTVTGGDAGVPGQAG